MIKLNNLYKIMVLYQAHIGYIIVDNTVKVLLLFRFYISNVYQTKNGKVFSHIL